MITSRLLKFQRKPALSIHTVGGKEACLLRQVEEMVRSQRLRLRGSAIRNYE